MQHTLHTSRIVMTIFLLFLWCRSILFWWWTVVGCLLSLSLSLLDAATMQSNVLCTWTPLPGRYTHAIQWFRSKPNQHTMRVVNCWWKDFQFSCAEMSGDATIFIKVTHTQKLLRLVPFLHSNFCAKLKNHKTTTVCRYTYVCVYACGSLYLWKENVVFQVSHLWLY